MRYIRRSRRRAWRAFGLVLTLALLLGIDLMAFPPGGRAPLSDAATPAVGTGGALPGGSGQQGDAGQDSAGGGAAGGSSTVASQETAGDALARLPGASVTDGRAHVEAASSKCVTDEAIELLGAYRALGRCVLVREGYLDLFGETWGCLVQGDGWVDVCVVCTGTTTGSDLSVTRLYADQWEGEVSDVWAE